jgi:hypothetical protein
MAERYTDMSAFDREAVSKTLGAQSRRARDVAHGEGEALTLGGGKAELEVYPQTGLARVSTPDARVELYRVPRYTTLNGDRVVFEQGEGDERTRLVVRGDGRVSFVPFLRQPEGPRATTAGSDGPTPATPPSAASEAATAPQSDPSSGLKAERGEAGEVAVVRLTGRLGRDPWHRPDGDEPIGGFPLAVNSTDGAATTWHKVVVFGETATELAESFRRKQIRKGSLVGVTGQEVLREEPTARGVKKIREFRASEVMRVTYSRSRSAPRT